MATTPKVLRLVSSCGGCPNYNYYSGGVYHCALVNEIVRNKEIVAPFCPLSDYPSRTIAEMQATIMLLREPLTYGMGFALLTHVATKLKRTLAANGLGLTIPFKDKEKDREVYLGLDSIRDMKTWPSFEITFVSGEGTFKLSPDNDPPLLREETEVDGEKNYWRHHTLAA